jgi:hypothetical protein
MRTLIAIVFVLCAALSVAAQQGDGAKAGEQYAGVWSGTWDGAGSGGGGFELALEKPKDGPVTGRVSVTGEPSYKANLKTVTFDGAKMTAKYDFTPDEAAEVVLTATFDAGKATGEWSLREKASGNEVASGGWKVARK